MPSTNKTANLALNQYISSDMQAMIDYNGDMAKIDAALLPGGWTWIASALTYSATDAQTFTALTGASLLGLISVGMKLKLTQSTVKYFIVTAITSTTITLYGGTDYALINAAISTVAYSPERAPFGFPLARVKWDLAVISASDVDATIVAIDVWKNPSAALSILLPIGEWKLSHKCVLEPYDSTSQTWTARSTLAANSTNSETDIELSTFGQIVSALAYIPVISLPKVIVVAVKTTYYLNVRSGRATTNFIVRGSSVASPAIIRAECMYI